MKPEELLELAKKNTIESLIEDKIVQRLNENATQWPRPDGPGWDELSRRSKAFEKMCSPHNIIPLIERYIELEKLAEKMVDVLEFYRDETIIGENARLILVLWQKFKATYQAIDAITSKPLKNEDNT